MNFIKEKAMNRLLESLADMPCTKPSPYGVHCTGGGEYACHRYEYPDSNGEGYDVHARNREDAQAMYELQDMIDYDDEEIVDLCEQPLGLPEPAYHQDPNWDRFPDGHFPQPVPFSISERDMMLRLFDGYYARLEADVRKFYEHIEEMHAGDFKFAAGRVLKMYQIRMLQFKLKKLSAHWRDWKKLREQDDIAEANALNEDFRKGEIR